jgi:HK97 family phage portal protein
MVRELQSMGSVGTLFAIVTKLSNSASQVDWEMWRKSTTGKPEDRVQVRTHPALNLLNHPNDFFTRQELVETGQQHMELAGETWWVITRSPLSRLPLELWPVRPDKMMPVPDAQDFISGYVYTGPDGSQIPLARDQVIMLRAPNPMDPYRGMGPVQTILPDLTASNMAAQYVANFFTNSAEPGGIIEVDKRLSDDEFDEMASRWREQHQGVSNAHRVAVIEQGKWIDRKYSLREMQFTELRTASSETIREAFGFPKPMLGSVDNVNRANAESAEYVFAKWLLVPRLERIKQALNNDLLPLFFPPGAIPDVEFDYCNPVPEDEQMEQVERTSKATAAKTYIELGFDPAEVLDMLDVPELTYVKPVPPTPTIPPSVDGTTDPAIPPAGAVNRSSRHRHWPTDKAKLSPDQHPDLTPVQDSWERHLAELITAWTAIGDVQKSELIAQLRDIVASGTPSDLINLHVASEDGAAALVMAMSAVGAEAAGHVVAEAKAQGVTVNAVPPVVHSLTAGALVTAALLAEGLVFSTIREALRVWNPASTPDDVARRVMDQLNELTDAQPRAQLGAALGRAQRSARMNTLLAAPTTAWYASEQLDKNTCKPCIQVNGKWLGNSIIENVNRLYPTGGYVDCLGRDRCRGMVIGIWRPRQVGQ